jgi:CheY-like chemotaxis protein
MLKIIIFLLFPNSVDFLIELKTKYSFLENLTKLSHDLKEPLTSIKGFSQLILENYADELDSNFKYRLKEIYKQSNFLESKIDKYFFNLEEKHPQYDVLIIEDDLPTTTLLNDFFEFKGFTTFGVLTGIKALEEINKVKPKLILLDIILPDISGYEICEKIKKDKRFKEIPIYFITAIPELEVSKIFKQKGANGYFLKPFNFSQFKILFDYLK